ncbi:MAG: DHH family phosphoesterase [Candidatus Helarchaeota archaeon]
MYQAFTEFFQQVKPASILITSHENADPDALCSAFAVASLIQMLYPTIEIHVAFSGITLISQKIVNIFQLEFQSALDFSPSGIVIVDSNTIEQLGNLKEQIDWTCPVLILDHHVPHPDTKKVTSNILVDETAIATAELVYELYSELDITPSKETASLIFLGILSDSRHLLLANNRTIHIIHQLIQRGVDFSEMVELLSISMDRSERIARLKAAQRLKLYEFNEWLVVISHVSAFEASACRAFIRLGADVALVYAQTKDMIRISGRASTAVVKQTALNMATDIMEKIGPVMHGEGGGHNMAAGCNGTTNLEQALELALELLKKKLCGKN